MTGRNFLFFAFLISSALPSLEAAEPLPLILKEIEAKYQRAGTIRADFRQFNHLVAFNRTKESSGKITIEKPNRIRWETLKPDPGLFVSDGSHFFFYTPPFDSKDQGVLLIKKSSEVQSQLMALLLSGALSSSSTGLHFKIRNESSYILVPSKGTAATIEKAWVFIRPDTKLIWKVVLEHFSGKPGKKGNWTEIVLSDIELGKSVEDGVFQRPEFPNTRIIEE